MRVHAFVLGMFLSRLIFAQGCGPSSCPDQCYEPSNPMEGYQIHGPTDFCLFPNTGCGNSGDFAWMGCCRQQVSPILVDIRGDGFTLTNVAQGVRFQINPSVALKYHISWTAQGSDDAWLVLDRNEDGLITDFTELFGNLTPQLRPPQGRRRNGFTALAVYDLRQQGGNEDGKINASDRIFSQLRLWQDDNHNGISESTELHTLPELGIGGVSLDFEDSPRKDQYGNSFRYRARIFRSDGSSAGRWAWDVFLLAASETPGETKLK